MVCFRNVCFSRVRDMLSWGSSSAVHVTSFFWRRSWSDSLPLWMVGCFCFVSLMYLWAATGKGSNPGGKLSSFTGCLSIVGLGTLGCLPG